jgi:hypothetical protein
MSFCCLLFALSKKFLGLLVGQILKQSTEREGKEKKRNGKKWLFSMVLPCPWPACRLLNSRLWSALPLEPCPQSFGFSLFFRLSLLLTLPRQASDFSPPVSASPVGGITGMHHHARRENDFKIHNLTFSVIKWYCLILAHEVIGPEMKPQHSLIKYTAFVLDTYSCQLWTWHWVPASAQWPYCGLSVTLLVL